MNKKEIELNDKEIAKIGLNTTLEFYRALAAKMIDVGESIMFLTHVNSPFFNVIFDLRINRENSIDLVKIASEFFDAAKVPWSWFITPASLKNDLTTRGFSLLETSPAMYFNLLNNLPTSNLSSVSIKTVCETKDFYLWIQSINDAFEVEERDTSFIELHIRLFKNNQHNLKHYIAYCENIPIGSSTLFFSKDSVMLHNLSVKKSFRKQGVGTMLTLHMMQEAKELGYKHCFLDASETALSLYNKLGFKIYDQTLIYSKNL